MSLTHLDTIYRSFDIRGRYPEEITDDEVEKIGRAIVRRFDLQKVAVGRDIRPSADALFTALTNGIRAEGAAVIDLGLTTTPMTYFIAGSTDVDATVMITASHMPSEYNGLKITTEDAKPITQEVIQELREIVGAHTFSATETIGSISTHAVQPDWIAHFRARHDLGDNQFTVVVDPANMIGALEVETFRAFPQLTVHAIYDDFDHTTPNHEANPIKPDTLVDLGHMVRQTNAHLGIAFDGDADRVGLLDETGTPVPADLIGALIAQYLLEQHPGATVVYDLRASRALKEVIEAAGGTAVEERVGHSFIRPRMRELDAILGIELSGHLFFKESYFSEAGPLAVFLILELMANTGQPLSELVAAIRTYHHSGEINSAVSRTPEAIYADLRATYPEATVSTLDGLSLATDSWWATVRPSANDPVVRLNLEATDAATMERYRDAFLAIIRQP